MYSHYTDDELMRFVLVNEHVTPLELELAVRLERALREVEALDDTRRASESCDQAVAG